MARVATFDSSEIQRGLDVMVARLNAALHALVEYYAPRVQSYARENAPWTDRTSNARNGLTAIAEHNTRGPGRDELGRFTGGGTAHSIVLFHQMPYGIWLEVRWGGRYAIILPTIQNQGEEIMRTAQGLLGRL